MFIESITACGFIDIGVAKKVKFKTQEAQNINEISILTFVRAFSIIFDSKYNENYDFAGFVHANQEKSFVETVLWQSDESTFCDHSWLRKNRLRIQRDLKNAKKININGREVSVTEFHKAISGLGFVIHDGLHIHRLLTEEILRLDHFTSFDLWSLVDHLYSSLELSQIIEVNHQRKKARGQSVKKSLEQLTSVLPGTMKLRDDIKNFLVLNRRFRTLMSFVEEKKIPLLTRQQEKLEVELSEIGRELTTKSKEIKDLKVKYFEELQLQLKKEKFNQMVSKKFDEWRLKMQEIKFLKETGGNFPKELFENFEGLHSSAVASLESINNSINQLESSEYFALKVANKTKAWKLMLKTAQETGEVESTLEKMLMTLNVAKNEVFEKSKDIKEVDKEITERLGQIKEFSNFSIDQRRQDCSLKHFEIAKEVTEFDSQIWTRQKTLLELDYEISTVADLSNFNPSLIEKLKVIEVFVRERTELYADYHGPVFKYLKPLNSKNLSLWPHLSSTAFTIVFNTGAVARNTCRMLLESGINVDSLVFLGLNDLNMLKMPQPSKELAEKLISAESLVCEDVPFKKALKTLLQGIVLTDESNLNAVELASFRETVGFSTSGTTAIADNIFTFQSEVWKDLNVIEKLQALHGKIEKFAELKSEIVEDGKHLKDLMDEASKVEEEFANIFVDYRIKRSVDSLQMLQSLLQIKYSLQKTRLESSATLGAVQGVKTEEIAMWNEEELMEVLTLPENEDLMIGEEIEINLIKLMFPKQLIDDLHYHPLNFHCNLEEIVEIYFNHVEKYQKEMRDNREQFELPSMIIDSKLTTEIIELRCRIYEKKSEKSVIDSALKHSSDLVGLRQDKLNFDAAAYSEFKGQPFEKIQDEVMICHRKLSQMKSLNSNLDHVTMNQYGKLQTTLKKTCTFSELEFSNDQNHVGARTMPIFEKLRVTMLKDAVFSCRSSFSATMFDYLQKSSLVFFTRDTFEDIDLSDYNWDNFDTKRLKAMDFLIDWKDSQEKVNAECLRRIKALILIVHIIRTFSAFKFIIIDEAIFDDMNENLVQNLKSFLNEASSFIQIIQLKSETLNTEPMAFDPTINETPMDISFDEEPMETSENQNETTTN